MEGIVAALIGLADSALPFPITVQLSPLFHSIWR